MFEMKDILVGYHRTSVNRPAAGDLATDTAYYAALVDSFAKKNLRLLVTLVTQCLKISNQKQHISVSVVSVDENFASTKLPVQVRY